MRMFRVLAVLTLAVLAACSAPGPRPTLPGSVMPAPDTLRVQVRENGRLVVRRVPLEQYVAATILSEVAPPSADPRVLEAMFEVQAIISRTYAVSQRGRHARDGFDVCSTTHCQLYQPDRLRTSRWAKAAESAVRRTAGQLLLYDRAPALALFHADCGGHTSSASAVWGGTALPYLTDEEDEGPASAVHRAWRYEVSREALRGALNRDTRTAAGARLDRIEIRERDAAGRAERVAIIGTHTLVVRGEVLRDAIGRALGARTVMSTLFSVRRTADGFVFDGRGFGHGVGLCQAVAYARLQAGESPADVLAFYYPGTTLGSSGLDL
jgi:stage II sporulation protein D